MHSRWRYKAKPPPRAPGPGWIWQLAKLVKSTRETRSSTFNYAATNPPISQCKPPVAAFIVIGMLQSTALPPVATRSHLYCNRYRNAVVRVGR